MPTPPAPPSNFIARLLGRFGEPDPVGPLVPLSVDAQTGALMVDQRQARLASCQKMTVGTDAGVVLLNDNHARKGYKIYNGTGADLYVKEGGEAGNLASTDDFSFIIPGSTEPKLYECYTLVYTGKISAIAATAGTVRVTELS
ncbi:MAG: hypothetical protein ABMA26_15065 [Limisphaerales bacterium]